MINTALSDNEYLQKPLVEGVTYLTLLTACKNMLYFNKWRY